MKNCKIDALDLKILKTLHFNARLSKSKIAQSVNLREMPCWRRVQQMEDEGIIKAYTTLIDQEKLGFRFQSYVQVDADVSGVTSSHEFQKAICSFPAVQGFFNTIGDFNYLLHVVTRNVQEFHFFLEQELKAHPCVKRINSSVVLNTIKNENSIILRLI